MNTMLQDLHYALRSLRKNPGFTAVALLCLTLGIGANTTVFSAVNTLLLRPLPFAEPDRLMILHTSHAPQPTLDNLENHSYPEYLDWSRERSLFSGTAAFTNRTVNLGGVDEPERLKATRVTASLFQLLGVQPVLGRSLLPEEEMEGKVAVLSHGLWQRRFGGAPEVVGRSVTVNGEPYTVVGVMPRGFRFPETSDLWLPLEPGEAAARRHWRQYDVLARLQPGVTLEQARERVEVLAARLAQEHPEANAGRGGWLQPYREMFARQVRPIMLVMLGAVGFVLLIACANVASLLLARATVRQREIAVRAALGASRARILRQLLTESLLIALLGGVLGAFLGAWGIAAVARTLPSEDLPFWMVFDTDWRVLLFTLGITVVTGVVFGLAPALQASRPELSETLKAGGGRGLTPGARTGRLRGALVVSQITLSLVLLIGAMLMIQSFLRLHGADPGFRSENVLTFETSLQGVRYEEDEAVRSGYRTLLERLEAVPGVEQAGAVSQLPIGTCCSQTQYFPEGSDLPPSQAPTTLLSSATAGFFRALEIPLLEGRHFDARDAAGAPRVAVVNRTLAERMWPGASPLGRRLRFEPQDSVWFTVVGVVGDVKQRELSEPDRPHLYLAYPQSPWRTMAVVVRTTGDPVAAVAGVREALRSVDPDLPAMRLLTMEEVVSRRMFQPRVYGTMFGVFALAALLLASIGLYGVVAYAVAQRTHEIAVRMALGGRARDILRLVVGQGARLTVIGLGLGLPAAFALTRLLRGALYGVSPSDPLTFISIPLLLGAVALLASYLPARRATRVDPMMALRAE